VLVAGGFPISKDGSPQCEVYRIQDDVTRVRALVKQIFSCAEVLTLVDSSCSVDDVSRVGISRSLRVLPYKIDALGLSLCRRPCFWWFDWIVEGEEGAHMRLPPSSDASVWGGSLLRLTCSQIGFCLLHAL
jgi:hypothetical protein